MNIQIQLLLKLNFVQKKLAILMHVIQIQLLLKLNYNSIIEMQYFKHNSNTTLVKVKLGRCRKLLWYTTKIQIQLLLKLNAKVFFSLNLLIFNSNTTLVKVKLFHRNLYYLYKTLFKYNSC